MRPQVSKRASPQAQIPDWSPTGSMREFKEMRLSREESAIRRQTTSFRDLLKNKLNTMCLGNSSGKGQMENPLDFMRHTVCLNYSATVAGKQP